MKTELASIELMYLVEELQKLVGSRVDKIYQPDGFLFQLHKTGMGKVLLKIEKNALYLAATKPEMEESKGLTGVLRKHLEGKKLASLEQLDSERIVKLTFTTQKDTYYLYVELFANGNVVLTDKEGIVLAAVEERAWKDREIRRGQPYKRPPTRKNVFQLTKEDFESTQPLGKHIATLGFGKTYAEELCKRANIDQQETKPDKKLAALFKEYQKVLNEKAEANVYPDGEITPIQLASKENGKAYKTFSQALEENLGNTAALQKLTKKAQKIQAEKERINKAIEIQEKSAKQAEEDTIKYQRAGELVYEHYQELKTLLDELNLVKKKHSLHEIAQKLKGHAVVKNVNPKTQEITIDVSD
ncbi:NFACT family protein [Candidatus Woesearchaeota archaeon]|nr:NFACT family protein [Candidatus Woesearchaeota archaeon]